MLDIIMKNVYKSMGGVQVSRVSISVSAQIHLRHVLYEANLSCINLINANVLTPN